MFKVLLCPVCSVTKLYSKNQETSKLGGLISPSWNDFQHEKKKKKKKRNSFVLSGTCNTSLTLPSLFNCITNYGELRTETSYEEYPCWPRCETNSRLRVHKLHLHRGTAISPLAYATLRNIDREITSSKNSDRSPVRNSIHGHSPQLFSVYMHVNEIVGTFRYCLGYCKEKYISHVINRASVPDASWPNRGLRRKAGFGARGIYVLLLEESVLRIVR